MTPEVKVGSRLLTVTLRLGDAAERDLPKPRLVVDDFGRATVLDQKLAHRLRNLGLWPVAKVNEDPAKRLTVLRSLGDQVDPANTPLAEKCLEGLLDLAPGNVGEDARNAKAEVLGILWHVCHSASYDLNCYAKKVFNFFFVTSVV